MRSPTLLALWLFTTACLAAPAVFAAPPGPQRFVTLGFDTQVGRITGSEADSEGPKSFTVKPDGGALLLDQVNLRILDFGPSGQFLGAIPLPAATFDDLELFSERYLLVVDRLVTRTMLVMDLAGTPLMELELQGRGITDSGSITALIPESDGLWLEIGHRYSVRALCPPPVAAHGDADALPRKCTRQMIQGRPHGASMSLVATLQGQSTMTLSLRDRFTREETARAKLSVEGPLRRTVWVDSAPSGAVHAVLNEAWFDAYPPFHLRSERYVLVALDKDLVETGRTVSPHTLTLLNQRVEFRSDARGNLWQLAFDDRGVTLMKWRLP